jgi:hypothetical protein
VTVIPPHASRGNATLMTRLLDPSQQEVTTESQALFGGLPATRLGRTISQSVRTRPDGPPGRYSVGVILEETGGGLDATEIPVELGVQFLAPGEEVGLTRTPGELSTPTPTPTPTPSPVATAAAKEGESALGGWLLAFGVGILGLAAGFGAAAILGRGSAA